MSTHALPSKKSLHSPVAILQHLTRHSTNLICSRLVPVCRAKVLSLVHIKAWNLAVVVYLDKLSERLWTSVSSVLSIHRRKILVVAARPLCCRWQQALVCATWQAIHDDEVSLLVFCPDMFRLTKHPEFSECCYCLTMRLKEVLRDCLISQTPCCCNNVIHVHARQVPQSC